jgi:hypothetical protein
MKAICASEFGGPEVRKTCLTLDHPNPEESC